MGIGLYKLEISVETPKYVKIDQVFKTTYRIKNVGTTSILHDHGHRSYSRLSP